MHLQGFLFFVFCLCFFFCRYMFMSCASYYMLGLTSDDIIYDALPLYHSAGGIVGAGQAIACGVPVAIRKKFSASNFWKDCVKYKCTVRARTSTSNKGTIFFKAQFSFRSPSTLAKYADISWQCLPVILRRRGTSCEGCSGTA